MKRILGLTMLITSSIATINLTSVPAARAWGGDGCSLASVAGTFDFTYNGVGILPTGEVPVAAVGKFSSDGAGNFVGDEINTLAGNAAYQTLSGKITVNPDCSGTLVAKVYQAGALVRTSYIHLQYADNANHLAAVFQKLVLPNGSSLPVVITISGERIFSNRDR